MSNLSELLPTGGGQNAVDFVASGTLSSGQTVILRSDGKVEAVAETNQSAGPATVFAAANLDFLTSTFDSLNNKVVIAYQNQEISSYAYAVVGTVSGSVISFGTPVLFESADTQEISATFDSNSNKVVIAYQDRGNLFYGTAIVGTVSGTSISFGSPVVFESAIVYWVSATFDSNSNKVVIAYLDAGNASAGTAIVGTVSGTSISFGSPVVFETGQTQYISTTFDSISNQVLIFYNDGGNGDYGTYAVGAVSGTSISFGSPALFKSGVARDISSAYDTTAQKVVVSYRDNGNSGYGTSLVGTVSGTAITFGAEVVFNSASTSNTTTVYDVSAQKIVISYSNSGNSGYGTAIAGTVSGTSISFGAPLVFEAASSANITSTFDSNSNKVVIAYRDGGNLFHGTSVVFTNISTNYTSFIGITAEAIANTATGPVNVYGGINEAQTGLTIGSDYYVQANGSLSTTASTVKVGQAISATTINMMDLT